MIDDTDIKILDFISKKTTSGQEISEHLSISRVAVWKRIKKLKDLGYKIDTSPSGYKLVQRTELLIPQEIKPLLKTKLIGKNYLFFKEIQSTNTFAKSKDFDEGTVIVAHRQTKGKGRKDRKWVSSGKGIYFSIVIKPDIPVNEILRFSLIFPVAVLDTVKKFSGKSPYIKWPNDIYLNGKKISGILIESDLEAERIKKMVVGIGINVNDTQKDINQIKDIATSIFIETGKITDKRLFFSHLLNTIEHFYFSFLSNIEFRRKIIAKVNEHLLWKGEKVSITDDNEVIYGILKSINQYGGLILDIQGQLKEIYSGDLTLRKV